MKLYRKEIRPMVTSLSLNGIETKLYPADEWYDEDLRDVLTQVFEKIIKERHCAGELFFDERFVEIEEPQIQTLNIKSGDVVLFTVNIEQWALDSAMAYVNHYQKILPKDCTVLLMPNTETKVVDKETAHALLKKCEQDLLKN